MSTNTAVAEKELFIKMVLSNWELQIGRMSNLLAKLSDEELSAHTAPGRNSGIYILGHLAAVSDGMLTLLGLGERLDPAMDNLFLRNAENSGLEMPTVPALREFWNNVNTVLTDKMGHLNNDEWFTRHTAVSEEDFVKEPHRNKLNLIMNRTNHLSYHIGQLVYLLKK